MVFKKIKTIISGSDEKYEILLHKYSQLKLENKKIKLKFEEDLKKQFSNLNYDFAKYIINLYSLVENVKNASFKVKSHDTDFQKMLIEMNTVEKEVKQLMKIFLIEEFDAKDRFYDPDIYNIASYKSVEGMPNGLILKTAKKGFKYRGDIVVKPKVVVNK